MKHVWKFLLTFFTPAVVCTKLSAIQLQLASYLDNLKVQFSY